MGGWNEYVLIFKPFAPHAVLNLNGSALSVPVFPSRLRLE